MAGTGAHLPSRQSGEVDVGPLLFDRLPMRPPYTFCKVKGEICLTRCSMAREVEFWDEIVKQELLDVEIWVVFGEAFEEINRPFTSDVVRNHDH